MNPVTNGVSKPLIPFTPAPHSREETGIASDPMKYIVVACLVSTLAAVVFTYSFPLSVALVASAAWLLWSGIIIFANRAAEGKRFAKPIHLLHSIAMEFNAAVVSAALFPLTLFKKYHLPQGSLNGRPILMANGYLSYGSTWHYMRKHLANEGFGPIYTMNIGSGKSIKTYAGEIHEKVKEIQKETGRDDLSMVCHSKGGLVGAFYATEIADKAGIRVTDVITIGSPLAGTPMAYIGLGQDAAEMRSDSEFHKILRNRIKETKSTRFYHIASETDEVVPRSSALIGDRASQHLLLTDHGHLCLLYSSRVAKQVSKWLQR